MVALGDPSSTRLDAVKEKVLQLVSADRQTITDLYQRLPEPRPSDEQVRQALIALAKDDVIQRHPPIDDPSQGKRQYWYTTDETSLPT
jgi:hypothetical protein